MDPAVEYSWQKWRLQAPADYVRRSLTELSAADEDELSAMAEQDATQEAISSMNRALVVTPKHLHTFRSALEMSGID